MRVDSTFRVMWLLNHTAARKFEISMLNKVGVTEVFTPKLYPTDITFRSSSVDYEQDSTLTIPSNIVERLNQINWYETTTPEDWALANQYFDVCFFVLHNLHTLRMASRHFKGALLWRTYGLDNSLSYSKLLDYSSGGRADTWIKSLAHRFFFGQAYPHLSEIEPDYLASKAVYLPIGMHSVNTKDNWRGTCRKILFVCPSLGFSTYYQKIYRKFLEDFGHFPYAIGGSQPITVDDPNVIGWVTSSEHERNMREMRVMFYHSQEKYHIHYHPFEAVKSGMPLIFMAGGLLDRLGGKNLPGRCKTISEAQKKIERILNDDYSFIESVRERQRILLDAMDPELLLPDWQSGIEHIKSILTTYKKNNPIFSSRKKRIAIILPVEYKGGSLRAAKTFAEAIRYGSVAAKEDADIVFLYQNNNNTYSSEDFSDLHPDIKTREYQLNKISADGARRAMRYAGHENWEPTAQYYATFDDGIQQLHDCDLWIIISDRLNCPILPIKSVVHVIYDYIQRYIPFLGDDTEQNFLDAARAAERVLVTTDFTYQDTLQYTGLKPEKVIKLPMLIPNFGTLATKTPIQGPDYFLWTTNLAEHKNHNNAFRALDFYYEELDGTLNCMISGVNTENLLSTPPAHLKKQVAELNRNKTIRERLVICGNLSEIKYKNILSNSAFLWHPATIDNGTFSVAEAAYLKVPSLSSDYPAMREIDHTLKLNLTWMDGNDPKSMGRALKKMEANYSLLRSRLPSAEELAHHDANSELSEIYWKAISECL